MRDRHRVRRNDAIPGGDRDAPRDGRAPVVTGNVEPLGADGVGQAEDVFDKERQRIVLDGERARPRRVAALIGRHGAEPGLGERTDLVAPLIGCLRKPVQQDHDLSVLRACHPHVEREVAHFYLRHRDLASGLARYDRRSARGQERPAATYRLRQPFDRGNIHRCSIPRQGCGAARSAPGRPRGRTRGVVGDCARSGRGPP